ncbi:MAG: hypothetical protein AB7U75_11510 [Hyphomicrobiaceae bacterium]
MDNETTIFDELTASSLAVLVRENAWAYPALETLHILGIALVLGGIFLLDLRLIGFNRNISFGAMSRHIVPWVMAGIAVNIATGGLLFISDAAEFAANISFQIKLVLIALALANAAVFQATIGRSASAWDLNVTPPKTARIQGILSILLWVCVVTAGRMMAYLK